MPSTAAWCATPTPTPRRAREYTPGRLFTPARRGGAQPMQQDGRCVCAGVGRVLVGSLLGHGLSQRAQEDQGAPHPRPAGASRSSVADEPLLNRVLFSHKKIFPILRIIKDPALAGPAGLRDGQTQSRRDWPGGQDVASRRPPGGLPRGGAGTEPHGARTGSVEGCPCAAAWLDCVRPTGRHTSPTCKMSDPCPLSESLSRNT
jgi:hypothetical protein